MGTTEQNSEYRDNEKSNISHCARRTLIGGGGFFFVFSVYCSLHILMENPPGLFPTETKILVFQFLHSAVQ